MSGILNLFFNNNNTDSDTDIYSDSDGETMSGGMGRKRKYESNANVKSKLKNVIDNNINNNPNENNEQRTDNVILPTSNVTIPVDEILIILWFFDMIHDFSESSDLTKNFQLDLKLYVAMFSSVFGENIKEILEQVIKIINGLKYIKLDVELYEESNEESNEESYENFSLTEILNDLITKIKTNIGNKELKNLSPSSFIHNSHELAYFLCNYKNKYFFIKESSNKVSDYTKQDNQIIFDLQLNRVHNLSYADGHGRMMDDIGDYTILQLPNMINETEKRQEFDFMGRKLSKDGKLYTGSTNAQLPIVRRPVYILEDATKSARQITYAYSNLASIAEGSVAPTVAEIYTLNTTAGIYDEAINKTPPTVFDMGEADYYISGINAFKKCIGNYKFDFVNKQTEGSLFSANLEPIVQQEEVIKNDSVLFILDNFLNFYNTQNIETIKNISSNNLLTDFLDKSYYGGNGVNRDNRQIPGNRIVINNYDYNNIAPQLYNRLITMSEEEILIPNTSPQEIQPFEPKLLLPSWGEITRRIQIFFSTEEDKTIVNNKIVDSLKIQGITDYENSFMDYGEEYLNILTYSNQGNYLIKNINIKGQKNEATIRNPTVIIIQEEIIESIIRNQIENPDLRNFMKLVINFYVFDSKKSLLFGKDGALTFLKATEETEDNNIKSMIDDFIPPRNVQLSFTKDTEKLTTASVTQITSLFRGIIINTETNKIDKNKMLELNENQGGRSEGITDNMAQYIQKKVNQILESKKSQQIIQKLFFTLFRKTCSDFFQIATTKYLSETYNQTPIWLITFDGMAALIALYYGANIIYQKLSDGKIGKGYVMYGSEQSLMFPVGYSNNGSVSNSQSISQDFSQTDTQATGMTIQGNQNFYSRKIYIDSKKDESSNINQNYNPKLLKSNPNILLDKTYNTREESKKTRSGRGNTSVTEEYTLYFIEYKLEQKQVLDKIVETIPTNTKDAAIQTDIKNNNNQSVTLGVDPQTNTDKKDSETQTDTFETPVNSPKKDIMVSDLTDSSQSITVDIPLPEIDTNSIHEDSSNNIHTIPMDIEELQGFKTESDKSDSDLEGGKKSKSKSNKIKEKINKHIKTIKHNLQRNKNNATRKQQIIDLIKKKLTKKRHSK